jgi:hypothetical protein
MTWTRGEKYLAISFFSGVCHRIDHVLRYDHSGWPFRPEAPFTYSFLVYPVFLVAALSSRYPRLRITPLPVKSAWKKTLAAQKREPLQQSLRRNR